MRGRSTVQQLAHTTSLTPRQIRNGLAVLIQYNLLYFYVDDFAGTTTYEANPHAAYGLLRSGKLLEMAESLFGPAVKDVLQNLLVLGQTRISDLNTAYRTKILERD